MSAELHPPPLPEAGKSVPTACGGVIAYMPDTPTTTYRGRRIYFCLQECLQAFLKDPKTSCMAADPLVEEEA
jgi:hypothetical protein